ncbi:hypothetical protein PG988_013347 [Apiospora saccharicola]
MEAYEAEAVAVPQASEILGVDYKIREQTPIAKKRGGETPVLRRGKTGKSDSHSTHKKGELKLDCGTAKYSIHDGDENGAERVDVRNP